MPYYLISKPDELAHARAYSHKYIRKEPDGHGGYKYYYKTDLNVRPVNSNGTITAVSYSDGGRRPVSKFRQADKASQIYREGQKQQYRDRLETQIKKPKDQNKYPGWKTRNSLGVTGDMFKNASERKDNLNKLSRYRDLTEHEKGDLQWETSRANTEGRNYAALMQEKSRQDKANKKKSIGDYAKQAVSAISTAAGSAYDAGKKWLSSIFK